MLYRQCHLTREPSKTILSSMTSWLPEKFAVVGKVLRLKNDGQWEDGWKVQRASRDSIDGDLLTELEKMHRLIRAKVR